MRAPALYVQLENALPERLSIGGGTALFVCGWCFHPQAPIRGLELIVDGVRQPVLACGMPRLEPFLALHPRLDPGAVGSLSADPESPEDPLLHSYRSGFWGLARVTAPRGGDESALTLALAAQLADGREVVASLGRIAVTKSEPTTTVRWPQGSRTPRVAIAMATYNPPPDLLRLQIDSIRAQTHENWVCIVSDDCSSQQSHRDLLAAIDGDERFIVSRAPRRLGFYLNFERALTLVPSDAEFVAMADQDDVWHRDKLGALLEAIGDALLVYSDARIVARDGELISRTWWSTRVNNHSDPLSLLVANAVTGAASLMRRELLDDALPFPPAQFAHFHDHWVALVALALGEIAYVERPLYDYVQHSAASLGHAAANAMTPLRERLRRQRSLRERVRMWRLHYFVDVCRLLQLTAVLELRCGARMAPAKHRGLRRLADADTATLPLGRLAVRGARELLGTPETLGAEWMLLHALLWRRLLVLSARKRPTPRLRLDAQPPPSLIMAPGHADLPESARVIAEKIAPLPWAVSEGAPHRVNLLIPTVDLKHFFGGYITKLGLARRLSQRGVRVRVVTVDPVGALPPGWQRTVESYSGLAGLLDDIEVVFGREAPAIEISPDDGFIATTWWTAHIARHALEAVRAERFVYLIQEYEPFTFEMGTYAALAADSYTFPHFALFSSELLRGYFRAHRIGVYAAGRQTGEESSLSFENAITPVSPPTRQELERREVRKLLFYARPEAHARRNMFELGLLALTRAVHEGLLAGQWELHGIGTVQSRSKLSLGNGAFLDLLPRTDQDTYAALLRDHDVGLALMYTPHPSLVPIEMASAGLLTVTTAFENKTAEAMAAISPNLIAAPATIAGVSAALGAAASRASDLEGRIRASHVRWATDWEQAFDERLVERILAVLAPASGALSAS